MRRSELIANMLVAIVSAQSSQLKLPDLQIIDPDTYTPHSAKPRGENHTMKRYAAPHYARIRHTYNK